MVGYMPQPLGESDTWDDTIDIRRYEGSLH